MTAALTASRPSDLGLDLHHTLRAEIHRHLRYALGMAPDEAGPEELLWAASHALRTLVMDRLLITRTRQATSRRLVVVLPGAAVGPLLRFNAEAMGLRSVLDDVLAPYGSSVAALAALEEPVLHGRVHGASFSMLEALASADRPATGYTLLWRRGTDPRRNPWWIARPTERVGIPLGGRAGGEPPRRGERARPWTGWDVVFCDPWDLPVVGHGGRTVQRLRVFVVEEVERAPWGAAERALLETYLLGASVVRDLLRRHDDRGLDAERLDTYRRIHLDGPGVALVLVELQRALVDEYHMDWDRSWNLVKRLCTWRPRSGGEAVVDRDLLERLLPRHLQIMDILAARGLIDGVEGGSVRLDVAPPGLVQVDTHGARSPRVVVRGTAFENGIGRYLGRGWLGAPERLNALEAMAVRPDVARSLAVCRRWAKARLAERWRWGGRDPARVWVSLTASDERGVLLGLHQLAYLALHNAGPPSTWIVTWERSNRWRDPAWMGALIGRFARWLDRIDGLELQVEELDPADVHLLAAAVDRVLLLGDAAMTGEGLASAACFFGAHTVAEPGRAADFLARALGSAGVTTLRASEPEDDGDVELLRTLAAGSSRRLDALRDDPAFRTARGALRVAWAEAGDPVRTVARSGGASIGRLVRKHCDFTWNIERC